MVVKWKGFIQSITTGNETPMNYDEVNGKLHIEMTQISVLLKAAYICFIWMLAEMWFQLSHKFLAVRELKETT